MASDRTKPDQDHTRSRRPWRAPKPVEYGRTGGKPMQDSRSRRVKPGDRKR